MNASEMKEFIRLNKIFHRVADKIRLDLTRTSERLEDKFGCMDDMRLVSSLSKLSENTGFIWFGEDGDEGIQFKIPIAAFTATDNERKLMVEKAVDDLLDQFKRHDEEAIKRAGERERELYEHLKIKYG